MSSEVFPVLKIASLCSYCSCHDILLRMNRTFEAKHYPSLANLSAPATWVFKGRRRQRKTLGTNDSCLFHLEVIERPPLRPHPLPESLPLFSIPPLPPSLNGPEKMKTFLRARLD